MSRIFGIGDIHGQVGTIKDFCEKEKTTLDDILILLGDAGFNYGLDENDRARKNYVSNLPITLLCVHGNHEERHLI